jgi:hypothetical protein
MSIYVSQSLSKPPQMIAGSGFEIGKCTPLYPISTDEDPGLRIESFAVINLRGVSTNKSIIKKYFVATAGGNRRKKNCSRVAGDS